MTTETTAPAADNVADIIKLGEKYAQLGGDKVAQEYLRSGRKDLAEFQTILLERIGTKGSETASDLGMSRSEASRFSVVRLVRALANPSDRAARDAAAFEFGWINRRLGLEFGERRPPRLLRCCTSFVEIQIFETSHT